jgi:hypothetical protein
MVYDVRTDDRMSTLLQKLLQKLLHKLLHSIPHPIGYTATTRYIAVAAVGLLMALAGCSTTKPASTTSTTSTTKPTTATTLSGLCATVAETFGDITSKRAREFRSIKSTGTLSASMKNARQTVQFEGRLLGKDSLLILLYGPLGITVGKLQSVPKFVQFYFALDNTLYEGEPTRKNFERMIRVPISYDEIVTFLRGDVPGGASGFVLSASERVNELTFTRQKDSTVETLMYSCTEQILLEYHVKNLAGQDLVDVVWSNPITVANIRLAQDIIMQFPQQEAKLTIQLSSPELNTTNERYSFVPPSGVPVKKF